MVGVIPKLSFGDIIKNYWSTKDNPHHIGVYIRKKRKSIVCTDMQGNFWESMNDAGSRNERIGTIFVQDELLDFYDFRENFTD